MMRKKKPKTATIHSRATLTPTGVLAWIVLLSTIIPPLQAQHRVPPDSALIFGTVWGPDDRPLYGVNVKIRRVGDKKARWQVHSNHFGEFEQQVPVGRQDYVISADLEGYKNRLYKHLQPGPEVTVHIESNERVDTGLHLK